MNGRRVAILFILQTNTSYNDELPFECDTKKYNQIETFRKNRKIHPFNENNIYKIDIQIPSLSH